MIINNSKCEEPSYSGSAVITTKSKLVFFCYWKKVMLRSEYR